MLSVLLSVITVSALAQNGNKSPIKSATPSQASSQNQAGGFESPQGGVVARPRGLAGVGDVHEMPVFFLIGIAINLTMLVVFILWGTKEWRKTSK